MRLFTDPHIGRRAVTHTTNISSRVLDAAIVQHALTACTAMKHSEDMTVVCAGDLFDKSHNKEADILDGLKVCEHIDLLLAGNHDLANRDDVSTSVEIMQKETELCCVGVGDSGYFEFEDEDDVSFTVIPHHSSQDLFDKAINDCCAESTWEQDLVILHCNYNNPHAQNDSSLNLSPEQADKLLKKFKYIVLGHEHGHRIEKGGRLYILGNTHPTSFSDISDKFYFNYTPDGWTKHKIWDKKTGYCAISVSDLLEGKFSYAGQNFIEIVGSEVDPKFGPDISKAMQALWRGCDSRLYMIRNNVHFKCAEKEAVDKSVQLENVTDRITEEVKNTDLLPLWEKHLKQATRDA